MTKRPDAPLVGFIGQGYVGKHYADDFERRGFRVVRYALEEPHRDNESKIQICDIVFIAVPTPTTPDGFDDSAVRASVALVGKGKTAVIKSTVLPGTTASIQAQYPDRVVLCAPEFLSEATAAHDAAHPFSNIIGVATDDAAHREAAKRVHALLPPTPFSLTCAAVEAEIIKYAHNGSGYVQIVFFNLAYDLARKFGAHWELIEEAIAADPLVCNRYAKPVHKSGRGAGGNCFIKDFAALRALYEKEVGDAAGAAALAGVEKKNIALLKGSGKDLNLLQGVYGNTV